MQPNKTDSDGNCFMMIFKLLALVSFCIAIDSASWMSELKDTISERKLFELDVPGAHHAGFLKPKINVPIISGLAVCQSETITSLLHNGVRWLDLRIAESQGDLVFSHTLVSRQKFYDGIAEINDWLKSNNEIVILDLNLDSKAKPGQETAELQGKLEGIFGDMIISRSEFATWTVQELVANNKRVLLTGRLAPIYQIPQRNSWSDTKESDPKKLVVQVVEWIGTRGKEAIDSGILAVSSAAVTPAVHRPFSLKRSAGITANELKHKLPTVPTRLGIIAMDFVQSDLAMDIVQHNLV